MHVLQPSPYRFFFLLISTFVNYILTQIPVDARMTPCPINVVRICYGCCWHAADLSSTLAVLTVRGGCLTSGSTEDGSTYSLCHLSGLPHQREELIMSSLLQGKGRGGGRFSNSFSLSCTKLSLTLALATTWALAIDLAPNLAVDSVIYSALL